MTRKTDDLSLTREQTDLRIRRTARVASALCWVAAVVTAALAAASLVAGDFICCAVGLVLMAVARMFEYGCILQRQDDETL